MDVLKAVLKAVLLAAATGCGDRRDPAADAAFEEGRLAGAAGLSVSQNPYPPSSQVSDLSTDHLRIRWFSGHNTGVALRRTATQQTVAGDQSK